MIIPTIDRLDGFLDMLAGERGRSPLTLSTYRDCLTAAAAWLHKKKKLQLADAGSDDLRAWLAAERATIAAGTQAKRLSALKHYYRFLISEGARADNPVVALDRPKAGRKLPDTLNEAELSALLAAVEGAGAIAPRRLKLLLELLYGSGLRAAEVVSLPRAVAAAALRPSPLPPHLIVRGKGEKERVVPLSPAALTALADYLTALKTQEKDDKGPEKTMPAVSCSPRAAPPAT